MIIMTLYQQACPLSEPLSRPRAGQNELAVAEDFDQIRAAMEKCPPYQAIFSKVRRRLPVGALALDRAVARPLFRTTPQNADPPDSSRSWARARR